MIVVMVVVVRVMWGDGGCGDSGANGPAHYGNGDAAGMVVVVAVIVLLVGCGAAG